MSLLRQSTLFLLVVCGAFTATADEPALYESEATTLSPPPGLETIGDSHGDIAVAANGDIYLSVEGGEQSGVQVYDTGGRYLRNLPGAATDYHGFRIHRDSDGQEHLFAIEMNGERLLKLALDGRVVMSLQVDELVPKALQARRFLRKGVRLTGIAVASNGLIFAADGYASSLIHVFDSQGRYLRSVGGKQAPYHFTTAHKVLVDKRFDPQRLLVTDRENDRLVWLDFEGNIVAVKRGLRLPSAIALRGDELVVGELKGRVVVLDRDGNTLAELGTNNNPDQIATPKVPPEQWSNLLVTAPHGVAFDGVGNILVTEWNRWGRVLIFSRSSQSPVL